MAVRIEDAIREYRFYRIEYRSPLNKVLIHTDYIARRVKDGRPDPRGGELTEISAQDFFKECAIKKQIRDRELEKNELMAISEHVIYPNGDRPVMVSIGEDVVLL